MKETLVYKKEKNKATRCLVCQRKCLILPGASGFCLTKKNIGGKLYSLNYGLIHGPQVDPIEKKPFYHFLPGTLVPSIGSFGCNFRCKQCLNWDCSWGKTATNILQKSGSSKDQEIVVAKDLIDEIKRAGYKGIAFTYNEPVVWAEYVLDTAKLAKKEGLFTLFVTNGSWTKETLDKIGPYIDATNIDFKGFSQKTYAKMGAFFGPPAGGANQIPAITKYAQEKYKIFIEITTLLIPGINDDEKELAEMTKWIADNLGPKTPWHLSQFDPTAAPDPAFQKIHSTTVEQLKKAADIGKKSGLEFIYIWAPQSGFSQGDTTCPKCGALAIKRTGWEPQIIGVNNQGKCTNCKEDLNVKVGVYLPPRV